MSRETAPLQPQKRTRIVAPAHETMASEHDMTQGPDRVLRSTGDAQDALSNDSVIERVEECELDSERTLMLAFMDEPVTIRIGTTTDENAEQIFEITINGKTELFRRGETKTVKRYFVDRLARLKETRFSHREVLNGVGDREVVYSPMSALKYDFAVTRDDNKLGPSWLAHTLREQG